MRREVAKQIPLMGTKMPCIYAIRCGDFVKVGFSANIQSRFEQIQTSNPLECELLHCTTTSASGIAEERKVLRALSADHVKGEWFRYGAHNAEHISAIFQNQISSLPIQSDVARIIDKMRIKRYSLRMIEKLLLSEGDMNVDYSLLCRIANEQRACSPELHKALVKLWGLMK